MKDALTSSARDCDLQLLTSGATQHVFLRCADPADGWVYKIPAVLDFLLPSRIRMGTIVPASGSKRLVHWMLYQLPRRLWRGLQGQGSAPAYVLGLGSPLASRYVAGLDHLLAAHLRRARVTAFRHTLRMHRLLAALGLAEGVTLPWRELPPVGATLHAGGRSYPYQGPILMQRRADAFFERAEGLERFEWNTLVDIQHRLWRRGIALADAAGAFGPQGWAVRGDRLLLGDTGSLTDSFDAARRVLAPDLLKRIERRNLRRAPDDATAERVMAYYDHVGSQINARRLAGLWRADLE